MPVEQLFFTNDEIAKMLADKAVTTWGLPSGTVVNVELSATNNVFSATVRKIAKPSPHTL